MKSSRIEQFFKLKTNEKIQILKEFANLTKTELKLLKIFPDEIENFDILIENRIGAFPLPFGIATNMKINGTDYLIPMVTEESSVVAALSNGGRYFRDGEGFVAHCAPPIMIGQIFIQGINDIIEVMHLIYQNERKILEIANTGHELLKQAGGGAVGIEVRELDYPETKKTLILHLLVNVADAMGANVVNTMCERVSGFLKFLTGIPPVLSIISNYAEQRLVRVWAKTLISNLGNNGMELAKKIEMLSFYAGHDIYRAVTHNKGIMNGIDSVLTATGQDIRANEAGIHAYAARNGKYSSLSNWRVQGKFLIGESELPLQVGVIGGAANIHPFAKISLKILNVKKSNDLARVVAACGLCQNFSALKALASTGIQNGHMRLHATKLAITAGASGKEIQTVAQKLRQSGDFTVTTAKKILNEIRNNNNKSG